MNEPVAIAAAGTPSRFCPRCRATFTAECAVCPDDGSALVADRHGETIAGRYQLRRLIGVGGMGSTVWQAIQMPLGRKVAVKLQRHTDDVSARRFDRGARIMGALSHPHITVVHDYGEIDDEHFLVMERLRGAPLGRFINKGPLPLRRALVGTIQLLRAADHLHRRNIVHRDLKPSNVFVTMVEDDDFFMKLLDFGIAKRMSTDDPGAEPLYDAKVTQQDRICGTPEYMAPEQVLGGTVDGRADLYAIGVCLYRMLTGALPFGGESRREIYLAKTRVAPRRLSTVATELNFSAAIEELVATALARDPAERFQTAADFRKAVTKALRSVL